MSLAPLWRPCGLDRCSNLSLDRLRHGGARPIGSLLCVVLSVGDDLDVARPVGSDVAMAGHAVLVRQTATLSPAARGFPDGQPLFERELEGCLGVAALIVESSAGQYAVDAHSARYSRVRQKLKQNRPSLMKRMPPTRRVLKLNICPSSERDGFGDSLRCLRSALSGDTGPGEEPKLRIVVAGCDRGGKRDRVALL
jgi:hypothetical protein